MSDWKERLRDNAVHRETERRIEATKIEREGSEVETFYANTVIPAFEELQGLLSQYGRQVNISPVTGYSNQRSATIAVLRDDTAELELSIKVEVDPSGSRASVLWTRTDWAAGQRSSFKDTPFEDSSFEDSSFFTSLSDITKEQIVDLFMDEYMPIFERSKA